jgi:hypothetical protein
LPFAFLEIDASPLDFILVIVFSASVESCKRNIKFNGASATNKVEAHLADARVYMLTHPKEFDVVRHLILHIFSKCFHRLVATGMCSQFKICILLISRGGWGSTLPVNFSIHIFKPDIR